MSSLVKEREHRDRAEGTAETKTEERIKTKHSDEEKELGRHREGRTRQENNERVMNLVKDVVREE